MILYLLNKNLYIYILKYIYGLNLYKINLLLSVNNVNIFNIYNNKIKIKLSLYRLNIYLHKILKIKKNNIIINKIKKFNIKK
ncbi:hypothetical protein PGAL8A_API02300 (apicoplast) [Plasmodium gallinaceum]|uniref:Open reading frame 91 n=1 Tax=Plasmodium gallinaceum TaxID=5849 RepID=H7CDX9_PLAGA|nr:hypothetical protein PGAL8A_API02300 [Plasmodium gallinaceum]BAL70749.1 open reading frame 91 [Plasmodium gallinaceum]CRG98238.1 hypothetical protein PGAL8A_API02300 [Plasmodium gallinaceum]